MKNILVLLFLFTSCFVYGQSTKVPAKQLQQSSATTGQVLKWNGSVWAPANDNSGTDGNGIYTGAGTIPNFTEAKASASGSYEFAYSDGTSAMRVRDNFGDWLGASKNGQNQISLLSDRLELYSNPTRLSVFSGYINVESLDYLRLENGAEIRWLEPGAGNYTAIKSGVQTEDYTYTWPVTAGSDGDVLKLGVGGQLSWVTPAAGTDDQQLSLSGTSPIFSLELEDDATPVTLSFGDGLSAFRSGQDLSIQILANTTSRLTGDGSVATPLDIAQQGATTGEVLKWNGTSWAPGSDNTGGVTDGDKGDITVSSSGTVWNIDAGVVGNTELSSGTGGIYKGSGSVADGTTATLNNNANFLINYNSGISAIDIFDNAGVIIASDNGNTNLNLEDGDWRGVSTSMLTLSSPTIIMEAGTSAPEIRIEEASGTGSNYTGFTVGNMTANQIYTLPTDAPNDQDVLTWNTGGTLSWESRSVSSINTQTGTSYTLVLSDAGKFVTLSNASAISLTVPNNTSVAYPVGTYINIAQLGAGQVTVTPDSGVTIVSADSKTKLRVQGSTAGLLKTATNSWLLFGDISL